MADMTPERLAQIARLLSDDTYKIEGLLIPSVYGGDDEEDAVDIATELLTHVDHLTAELAASQASETLLAGKLAGALRAGVSRPSTGMAGKLAEARDQVRWLGTQLAEAQQATGLLAACEQRAERAEQAEAAALEEAARLRASLAKHDAWTEQLARRLDADVRRLR